VNLLVHVLRCAALALCAGTAAAQPAGIREACRQTIERQMDNPGSADFGEYWNWTVVANRDGTYSVGARYRAGNRQGGTQLMYSTCIIRMRGKDFVIESLTRLR
jgi:hypothetical protein